MSLVAQQSKFVNDVILLIQYASRIGVVITFGEAYRPREMQEIYLKQGKSRTLKSLHLSRMAIDLNFFIDGKLDYNKDNPKLQKLGKFWEELDKQNKWGGNFKNFIDTPHFQRNIEVS